MAIKYEPTNPIPKVRRGVRTTYGGVSFRSLNEAHWAAFMDVAKWGRWNYEPFELEKYIPDFLLHVDRPLLVEVKPGMVVDDLMPAVYKIQRSGWSGDFLVVGNGFLGEEHPGSYAHLTLGLMSQRVVYPDGTVDWQVDRAMFHRCLSCGRYSFHHASGSWRCGIGGCYEGDHFLGVVDHDEAWALWREAGNRVQWKPSGGR